MALNLGWDNGRNRDRARSVFYRLNQMRWLISHFTADTGESLLLELLASRPTKIVLRLLIKSAAKLKLAKEDAADASADQERCYAKPMLLLMTRNAARVSRKQTNKGHAAVEELAKQNRCCCSDLLLWRLPSQPDKGRAAFDDYKETCDNTAIGGRTRNGSVFKRL